MVSYVKRPRDWAGGEGGGGGGGGMIIYGNYFGGSTFLLHLKRGGTAQNMRIKIMQQSFPSSNL